MVGRYYTTIKQLWRFRRKPVQENDVDEISHGSYNGSAFDAIGWNENSQEQINMAMYVTTAGSAMDVSSIQSALRIYFAPQEQVAVAYLFGSYARGQASALSDIDIAILLQHPLDAITRFSMRLRVTEDIKALLRDQEIDVVVLNDAPLALSYRVIRDSVVLYCRDEQMRIEWTASTVSRYLDFKPFMDRHEQAVLDRVRSGDLLYGYNPHRGSIDRYRQLRERFDRDAGTDPR